jgi:hypothetical protein
VPREGEIVHIAARPEDIHLFDAATRRRIETGHAGLNP